jgi:hypothetical protein
MEAMRKSFKRKNRSQRLEESRDCRATAAQPHITKAVLALLLIK